MPRSEKELWVAPRTTRSLVTLTEPIATYGNVCRWRDGDMLMRWVAGAFLLTEKHFRRIMGHRDLWSLAGILGRTKHAASSEKERVA